jgi:hypothetical protein
MGGREVEIDLESTLARLKKHRRTDPTGEASLATAMEAEAAVEDDPAEGARLERTLVANE